jgi:hypothetical protein
MHPALPAWVLCRLFGSRAAAKQGARGKGPVFEYEYRFTEYEYEGRLYWGALYAFRTRTQSALADGTRTRTRFNLEPARVPLPVVVRQGGMTVGGGQACCGWFGSREAAKPRSKGSFSSTSTSTSTVSLSTSTRGGFIGGLFMLFVLVLSPPWRTVLVLVLNLTWNRREFPCRWSSERGE